MSVRLQHGWLALAWAISFGLTAGAAHAQSQGQARPAIVSRAEQCLRQNADRVVAADRDMQSAASFLVSYACASEVAGAARYQRNSAYVQMMGTLFKTMGQASTPAASAAATSSTTPKPATPNPMASLDFKAMVDPETGEIVSPTPAAGAPPNPVASLLPMLSNIFGQATPESVPVDLRKLAGELVMAAHAKLH